MPEKIRHSSLDEKVYDKLRHMIVNRQLKPGEKIVQEELAGRLGVSRTPLRRALSQLAKENLVKMVPRGETYVKDFTLEEMISIFEIRGVLEGLACRKAALLITKKQVDYFRNMYEKSIQSAGDGDWVTYTRADEKFHNFITNIAQSELLKEIVRTFHILSNSYTRGLIRPPQETFPEHTAILDALENHDAEKTESLMCQHLRKSIEVLEARMSQKRKERK